MAVQNKTEQVGVRLTPEQMRAVRARAEEEGERVATWLRQLALREAQKDTTPQAA